MARKQAPARVPVPPPDAVQGERKKTYRPVTRPQVSTYLLPEIVERARDAVDFLSGPPERLTFTSLLERALETEINRLSKKYRGGRPFPKRQAPLRRGFLSKPST
jgi:hypothetical protein